jgi:hypothetical protein
MTVTAAPVPIHCAECGCRTGAWVLIWYAEQDRVPVCLACAALCGWAPTPPLVLDGGKSA